MERESGINSHPPPPFSVIIPNVPLTCLLYLQICKQCISGGHGQCHNAANLLPHIGSIVSNPVPLQFFCLQSAAHSHLGVCSLFSVHWHNRENCRVSHTQSAKLSSLPRPHPCRQNCLLRRHPQSLRIINFLSYLAFYCIWYKTLRDFMCFYRLNSMCCLLPLKPYLVGLGTKYLRDHLLHH